MFEQAEARPRSYQNREKLYKKYINGRLDHIDKMEEYNDLDNKDLDRKRVDLGLRRRPSLLGWCKRPWHS
jgi:hypothetical protein